MKLIAIETSTDICSIAYIVDGNCINIVEEKIPRMHAEKLPLFYNDLVKKSKLDLANIDAICVSIGPGSFTGLRIGLSYTKGLAYSHNKPIIPVPTLQSLYYANNGIGDAIMLYSHGKKYFFQNTDSSNIDNIHVLELSNISELPNIERYKKIIHYNCERLFIESDVAIKTTPSARWIGELAHKNFDKWIVKTPYKLVPNYVSPFKIGK